MQFNRKSLSKTKLLDLYKLILKPRLTEEKMLILLRQGKISKWFSGIGQEAVSVGLTAALSNDEYILPLHRNLGVFTSRNISLEKLFAQFQGKKDGFTNGRDRSFHFGSVSDHIIGMISHLGPQMGVADGIALADKLSSRNKVTVVFSGDGGASEGDFHEAINVAAVWDLPVIFVIENNGYGLSTPSNEQFRCERFSDKGIGYGIDAYTIDGNNLLEVFHKIKEIKRSILKKNRPVILECVTFRMRGHEEASGTKYVPKELLSEWSIKDPIKNYEEFLINEGVLNNDLKEKIYSNLKEEINNAWDYADNLPQIKPLIENEINDIYKSNNFNLIVPSLEKKKLRFVDAISDALKLSMHHYKNLIIMGQDIAEYGGVFKVTEGFVDFFGKKRVRNTPICESIILSASLGLSINGYKSIVELQFADFISSGFNAVVNNLAKTHYRWGQEVDVVLRMPTGAGVGAGPFHSQSNEAWFTHTPGLKVVYPAFPYDAKGLLASSIEDPNPVLFFEHKALYRSVYQEVPNSYYNIEIGKASLILEGNDVSIITYGLGVHWSLEILKESSISADLIDLRTLVPLDKKTIFESVKKTGKVIILHEDTMLGGIGADISSLISDECFEYLDAPIKRSSSLDTPVPFSSILEDQFLPKNRFKKQLYELLEY